jgi:glucose/arabinose dehydrogenase
MMKRRITGITGMIFMVCVGQNHHIMKPIYIASIWLIAVCIAAACNSSEDNSKERQEYAGNRDTVSQAAGDSTVLPAPFATPSVEHFADVTGWPEGKTPIAPAGFTVSKFADGLENPRWIYVAPNGDIFVCETNGKNDLIKTVKAVVSGKAKAGNVDDNSSANRITVFRETGGTVQKTAFLTGLNHPLGMLVLGNYFYVANNDAVWRFPYKTGDLKINGKGEKILSLPAGPGHWTRNILSSRDGKKIYVAVGSGSNVAEKGMEQEQRRADILEINPDGSGERIYASGLRNPVGMGIAPGTNTLWTAVNERDELGDELVPDYITSVKDGGFYGWPYSYWGQHEDPRMKDKQQPALVQKAIVPDVSAGPHTASLGLVFDEQNQMPGRYSGGAFIGQHGSWNRSQLSGYQVAFVPFKNGRPAGKMEPFLTGFIGNEAERKVYGRPVGVAITQNGDLLVADDASNTIWRVRPGQ